MEYGLPESKLIANTADVSEKHRYSFLVTQIKRIMLPIFLLKLRRYRSELICFHQMLISSLTYYFWEHLLHLSMRSEEVLWEVFLAREHYYYSYDFVYHHLVWDY